MAKSYPYNDTYKALTQPARDTVFFEDWTDEDTANDDLLCAEMSRLAYDREPNIKRILAPIGFIGSFKFIGDDHLLRRFKTKGIEGFIATHPGKNLTVLAFRGTEPDRIEDVICDADIGQTSLADGAMVHRGFHEAYQTVQSTVQSSIKEIAASFPGSKLLITGHSLGAALATIAALDLHRAGHAPALINFGSPLVGNSAAELDPFGIANSIELLIPKLNPFGIDLRLPEWAPDFKRLVDDHIPGIAGFQEKLKTLITSNTVRPDFAHVSDAIYISANGERRGPVPDAPQDDMEIARADYRQTHPLPAQLARFLKGDPVSAVRDLADHAPINYVSAFSGR